MYHLAVKDVLKSQLAEDTKQNESFFFQIILYFVFFNEEAELRAASQTETLEDQYYFYMLITSFIPFHYIHKQSSLPPGVSAKGLSLSKIPLITLQGHITPKIGYFCSFNFSTER